jgi:xylulokinase
MSGIVINIDNPAEITSVSINFEKNFPKYKTNAGAVVNPENKNEVWSYPQMWVEALDMLIAELSTKVNLADVRAIAGAGQQHATVYLNSTDAFTNLQFAQKGKLAQALSNAYATERAPIWMDCSTSQECAEIEKVVGADYILQKTGSLQTERFSGAQIRKIFKTRPDIYNATKRVHLNSSFICSVLCNNDAPVDYGDASGMNLLDLHSFSWDKTLLDATAPNLVSKLPTLVKPQTFAGNIGQYFCKSYGFSDPSRKIIFIDPHINPFLFFYCHHYYITNL